MNQSDLFPIGHLGKPHGYSGWIDFLFTDDIFDTADADYLFLEVDGLPVPFFIEEYRFRNDDTAIMKFENVETEDDARSLTGCTVLFERSKAGFSGDDISLNRLQGLHIVSAADGKEVGVLEGIDDSTANILFTVKTSDGRELLLPAPPELLKDIDIDNGTITMEIPDGLMDL